MRGILVDPVMAIDRPTWWILVDSYGEGCTIKNLKYSVPFIKGIHRTFRIDSEPIPWIQTHKKTIIVRELEFGFGNVRTIHMDKLLNYKSKYYGVSFKNVANFSFI